MGGAGGGICFDVSRFSDRQTKKVTLSLDLFIQFDIAARLFRKIKLSISYIVDLNYLKFSS